MIWYNEVLVSHEKKRNSSIYNNINGTRGHYAKQKSDRERQIPCDITYIWNLKKPAHRNRK